MKFINQALKVETASPLYFSAYIIRLLYKVAVFFYGVLNNLYPSLTKKHKVLEKTHYQRIQVSS